MRWRGALPGLSTLQQGMILRILFAACAFATTLLLMLFLHRAGRSLWWSILFAWNPLMIIESSGIGHQDILGALLVLSNLVAMQRRRPLLCGALLALACGVKPIAILLAPFIARELNAGRRNLVHFALALIVTLAAIYLPALFYQQGYRGWLETNRIYTQTWEANGSVYELIKHFFGQGDEGRAMERAKHAARVFSIAVAGVAMLVLWLMRANAARAGYWIYLLILLCSPVVYPWYLIWMLCFVPLVGGASVWAALVFAATVGISYRLWHLPTWVMPERELILEYSPVAAALLITVIYGIFRSTGETEAPLN